MTSLPELGRIEELNLRDIWSHEEKKFTPWLAENLSELGQAMGIEFELEAREAPVGTYSLDLLARVAQTNQIVIIENQLEPTNHDHMGKLLTYAGGFDANVVVWVAQSFRDEHKQALDWLNQHTDDEIDFFGVVVKVIKIEDSNPAPLFNVVVAPNQWRRETLDSIRSQKVSDRNKKYKQFFQKLIDRLRAENFTKAHRALPQNWYLFSVGHANRIRYGVNFTINNFVSVHVYIDHTDKNWVKDVFDKLYEHKDSIETNISETLKWERKDETRFSRIAIRHPGNIDEDDLTLNELQDWIFDKLLSLQRAFGPKLKELDKIP